MGRRKGILGALETWLRHEARELLDEERDSCPPPQIGPTAPTGPLAVPDVAAPAALAPLVRARLAGAPADGSEVDAPSRSDEVPRVVWVDGGDELLVHLDSLVFEIEGDVVIGAIDVETEETGRATLIAPFAVGVATDQGITLVGEGSARGPSQLVARWGKSVQEALFAALMALVDAHAAERNARPVSLHIANGALHFGASQGSGQ